MAKVLLVEDDNNLREIYEARLAAEGYEISSAQDGEEALVVAKQAKPDLVISDVMMPKISGFEMLDILRNTAGLEHVKVIMLTALGQSEDRDRADNLGADKYLVKSQVTLEDIVKTAHELLDDETVAAVASSDSATTASTAPEAAVATEVIPMAAAPEEPADEPSVPTETPAPVVTAADDSSQATPSVTDDTTSQDETAAETTEPVATAPVVPTTGTTTAAVDDQPAATDDVVTSDQPQPGTAAQEENLVTSQIDSFVSNLPDEAEAPVAAQPEAVISPEPTPEAPVEQATPEVPAEAPVVAAEPEVVAPTAEEAAATTADDKIMANAVNELAGEEAGASPAPVADLVTPEAPTETSPSDAQAEADKTNISINGKKTIQPIDSEPKPDINELLAREEAASGNAPVASGPAVISTPETEAQGTETATETPTIIHQPGQSFAPQPPVEEPAATATPEEDQPSGGTVPTAAPKEGGIDPNSIAL